MVKYICASFAAVESRHTDVWASKYIAYRTI